MEYSMLKIIGNYPEDILYFVENGAPNFLMKVAIVVIYL